MNKNTRQRLKDYRKKCRKEGWPTPVYKAKRKPFPTLRSRDE